MNINISKNGNGKINSTKGGSGKTNEKKYIDLLPPNFIFKVTLSGGTYGDGVYKRSSSQTNILNYDGPNDWFIEISSSNSNIYVLNMPDTFPEGAIYFSQDEGINWAPEGGVENPGTPPTGVTEKSLSFLFDPIFYKKEIQNERNKISVQGCSLSYVNGIYSQTIDGNLYNNRRYYIKDDDSDMRIYFDGTNWNIDDLAERDYINPLFYLIEPYGGSATSPAQFSWSVPDGGYAYDDGQTSPTITQYVDIQTHGADLDPYFLEKIRDYKIDETILEMPIVPQIIIGASFDTRKAEIKNNTFSYIKDPNDEDVEGQKLNKIWKTITSSQGSYGMSPPKDNKKPLLFLARNDYGPIFKIGNGISSTLNMFIKLQRPIQHKNPNNGYLVREKRGVFCVGGLSNGQPFYIGYRSPYYNITGRPSYKGVFDNFSFVFSFGNYGWLAPFNRPSSINFMTDYKFNFGQMYMLTIRSDNQYFKIYINGELQTVAFVPFNPLVNPSTKINNSQIKRLYKDRRDEMPLSPEFYKKDGSIYTETNNEYSIGISAELSKLIFGRSSLARGIRYFNSVKKKRYLNNLDIGVINSYNIALSQNDISQIYENFRYRYI